MNINDLWKSFIIATMIVGGTLLIIVILWASIEIHLGLIDYRVRQIVEEYKEEVSQQIDNISYHSTY